MQSYKYIIIGGGLAGQRAGDGIRKVDTEGSVALLTAETHPPYQRPPLSKGYLRGAVGLNKVYLKEEGYYTDKGIDVIENTRVTTLAPEKHRLTTAQGQSFGYEKLLLATGGHAWRLPLSGNNLPRVFTLRTIEDSDRIREAAEGAAHALVLGGSFIGSEVAASLTMSGLDVTMVFPESRLLERVAPEGLSAFLHRKYTDRGVRILSGTKPERLEGSGAVERAHLDNGETLDVDLVVMGVGIRLNTELARDAGLKLNEQGAVLVDDYLRTSDPDIYAAGDIAAWPDPTFEERLRVEHWDVARRQGRRAGQNMAGDEAPYTALPYFFSDMFDFGFEVWGNLNTWEETVTRGSLESGSFAFYYFDDGKLVGVMAVRRPDGERKPMQNLVRAGAAYEALQDKLTDENVDLNTLV